MSSGAPANKYADRMKKLRSLHQRRNEARKLNQAEVVEEDRRAKLPANYEAKRKRQEWELEDIEKRKAAEAAGEDYDRKRLLTVQADTAEKIEAGKRRKKNPDGGFSDFESMTIRAYQRNVKTLKDDKTESELMKASMGDEYYPSANTLIHSQHYPTKDACDGLVKDLEKQAEKRDKYHRRRMYDPEAPIDFINERNRKFNDKIERFYGKYTEDIKQNLERGTAV